jgi:protoporphyrinogen oxidase
MLQPLPPDAVVAAARKLQYRDLILVALLLNRASVTPNASLYFPSEKIPFTRVYEPRNRNSRLSPSGKTSLVAEITCEHNSGSGNGIPNGLPDRVLGEMLRFFHIADGEIEGVETRKVSCAYPLLETAVSSAVDMLLDYLGGFENLHLAGRNGKFRYSHIHDHILDARNFCSSPGLAAESACGRSEINHSI